MFKKILCIFCAVILLAACENDNYYLTLEEYGYIVNRQAVEIEEVHIPKEFDAVYNNYNKLQLEGGYDLREYRGKDCLRYTYEIMNHPYGEGVRGNLLIFDHKVIGGDISTVAVDGFMTALEELGNEN